MPEVLGVSLGSALVVAVLIAAQTAGGGLLWLATRREAASWTELIGMGFAFGTVIAVLGSQITIALGSGGWGWLAAPGAGVAVWLANIRRPGLLRWPLAADWRGVIVLLPALIGGLAALVPSVLLTPLKFGYVVGGEYQPDTIFQEALAQSAAHWGPSDSSMLAEMPIRYHWLVYGWIGNLTDSAGAEPFVVMTRLFPLVALIAAIALAAAWARALTRIWWVPGLAGVLVAIGGYVGALQGVVLTYDSPSTAYAAILGLAFGLVMTLWLRGALHPWALAMIGLLAFALVGAKASQALVIAVGVAGVAVWALFTRKIAIALPFVLASALGMVLGYVAFLMGVAGDETNIGVSGTQEHASTFQGLDPFNGSFGVLLGTIALLLAIAPRWIGALWLRTGSKMGAEISFAIGLALAAVITLAVLRSGTNAAWFALASTALLSVLGAVGVGEALSRISYRFKLGRLAWDPLVWAVIAAVLINVIVLFTFALAAVSGAPVFWRGPILAWVLAAVIALVLARFSILTGSTWIRWAVMLTVVITLTSIGSRINGSLVWGLAHSRFTPAVQDFIRVFDPEADFPNAHQDANTPRVRGAVRGASALRMDEDDRGEPDGVARRSTIIQWTPAMNEAAIKLREISDADSLVAVSRPTLQPFLPIISERRALVAGLPYSSGYTNAIGVEAAKSRVSLVDAFLAQPSADGAMDLAALGVQWLWITPESFGLLTGLEPWTQPVASNTDVVLLKLNALGASSS